MDAAQLSEAEARKERSIRRLRKEGIPFIDWLPYIETEADSHRRTEEEIVDRLLALVVVTSLAIDRDEDFARSLIEEFEVPNAFSSSEMSFLSSSSPSEQTLVNFSWRTEASYVLLWALQFIPDLRTPLRPIEIADIAPLIFDHGRAGLLRDARLRCQSELLDQADLIYRYHWATRDGRISSRDMEKRLRLDGDVVMERHQTLNWLIIDDLWDDVDTST